MLCFTRRAGQALRIGDEIVLTIERVRGGSVRLGFVVPKNVVVDREEVAETKKRARIASNLRFVAESRPADAATTRSARPAKPRRAPSKTRRRSADDAGGS